MSVWSAAADIVDPPKDSKIYRPSPKQQLADEMAARVDELLYGGAAGGGKTHWLVEYMARQCETHAGIRTIIFRRIFPSLNRTVIPLSKRLLYGRARYNSQEKTWTFPNGSVLEFGSLQYEDDVFAYQGTEYTVAGFEEITEFLQTQIDEITMRLRSTIPGTRPHMVATTNPGGVGHRWVKRRWVKPKKDDINVGELPPAPMEIWRPAPSEDLPRPPLRAFVPAKMQDNPTLMERDPGYLDRILRNRNKARRKALAEGDWDAIDQVEGALWDAADLEGGRVRPETLERIGVHRRTIAVDPSDGGLDEEGKPSGDAFGVSHCALGMDGVGYVLGGWDWRASPRDLAKRTVALYHEVGADAIVVERNHGGKWLVEVFKQVDPYANVIEVWASDGKRTRAEPVAALFEHDASSLLKFRARIAGYHEELEAELTETVFEPGMVSPNMLDALVWNLTGLCLGQKQLRERDVKDRRLSGRR